MARNKKDLINIDKSDPANYPDGRIRNNDGSNNGTEISEASYGDIHEFFGRMMREAKLTYNGIPDSASNGYQLIDAMFRLSTKNNLIFKANKVNDDTIRFEYDLSVMKEGEFMIFESNLKSSNLFVKALCSSPNWTKSLLIKGAFIVGQPIMVTNRGANIEVVGLYDSMTMPNLDSRMKGLEDGFKALQLMAAPILMGGAIMLWEKPANEIPQGWAPADGYEGKTIIGQDPNKQEFRDIGASGGSDSFNISKSNLPKIGIGYEDSYFIESHSKFKGIDGETTVNGKYYGNGSSADLDNNTLYWRKHTTDVLGDGTPIKHYNPYRIVKFIKYVGL